MSLLKEVIYQSIDRSGLNMWARKKNANSILFLTYHLVLPYSEKFKRFDYRNVVSTDNFDKQIRFLKKKYDVISLSEAHHLMQDKWQKGSYAVITFDDGFRNNYTDAYPVLKNNKVPATFYVCTNYIAQNKMLWTEVVTALLTFTKKDQIQLNLKKPEIFTLNSMKDVEKTSLKIRRYLKTSTISEKNRILKELQKQCDDVINPLEQDADRYRFMNWNEVREMADNNMEIGSHTENHILLNMADAETTFKELKNSKATLERELKRTCLHFSYPNGGAENYSQEHIWQLRQLGYHSAATQIKGFNNKDTDVFQIRRINISRDMSLAVFKAYTSGNYKMFVRGI